MVMTQRKRRRLLVLADLLMALGIAACLYGAFFLPLDPSATRAPTVRQAQLESRRTEQKVGPLSAYAVIYGRDLRKPLYDPEPVPVVKARPPEPRLSVTLAGTVVEPGFSRALLRTAGGDEKLVSVGEVIDKAEVLAIADGSVRLKFSGKEITLKVQREGGQ